VHSRTLLARRRLYLLARAVVDRHYHRQLTLAVMARVLSSSPRQLQRAYAQFGETTFQEDLTARRMGAAAQLLVEQPAIAVRDVARLVGYRQAPHFASAFRRRYGLAPARFRTVRRRAFQAAVAREARKRSAASPRSAGSMSSGSAPGRRIRMSVPPPGAGSAITPPPS
jgi:AraC family transcriptional regulator, regulatory protein of adaptative response / methylphosphotriester-DNA alkyltransferase methyltransferase